MVLGAAVCRVRVGVAGSGPQVAVGWTISGVLDFAVKLNVRVRDGGHDGWIATRERGGPVVGAPRHLPCQANQKSGEAEERDLTEAGVRGERAVRGHFGIKKETRLAPLLASPPSRRVSRLRARPATRHHAYAR